MTQEVRSIVTQLYGLPERTLTFNGHGDDTTIGASIDEFVQGAMTHTIVRDDASGDTTWGGE